jgi:hypothetical protein
MDKQTETRSNSQNPKNKIKIWTVYNGPRISGLKNSVSIELVWASPGGGNLDRRCPKPARMSKLKHGVLH